MPSTKTVKNIIDKLKKIGNKVTISATGEGRFSLLAKTMNATIEVHFRDLNVKIPKNTGNIQFKMRVIALQFYVITPSLRACLPFFIEGANA